MRVQIRILGLELLDLEMMASNQSELLEGGTWRYGAKRGRLFQEGKADS